MNESAELNGWLQRIESLHPSAIELGLTRAGQVLSRLRLNHAPRVITVGGTNGKGSVSALLDSILRAAGYRVGLYTSPHLWHYCERVRVDGVPVDDAAMVRAFEAVEAARGTVPLTYFEFGTLAALTHFAAIGVQVMVLEVGLGGRLDAVNLIDADVAVITNVGIDHQEWLGDNRDSIGHEKAGILRAGQPAIYGESDPPRSLLAQAAALNVNLLRTGRDYSWRWLAESADDAAPQWEYRYHPQRADHNAVLRTLQLPLPALPGAHQLSNAAAALSALMADAECLPATARALADGLQQVYLPGRMQIGGAAPLILLDVAHNPDGTACLAQALQQQSVAGRTLMIFSALKDKAIEAMLQPLIPLVDEWLIAPCSGPRALALGELQQIFRALGIDRPVHGLQSIEQALVKAQQVATTVDRIIVCGSFITVAAAGAALGLDRRNSWIKH